MHLFGGRSARTVRVQRSFEIVLRRRTSLSLVRVEQARFGPAMQHPCDLPTEVVTVGDRHVHTGAAPRRDSVRGVADEKRVALAKPFGHGRAERDCADPADPRLERRCTRGKTYEMREPLGGVVLQPIRVGSHSNA